MVPHSAQGIWDEQDKGSLVPHMWLYLYVMEIMMLMKQGGGFWTLMVVMMLEQAMVLLGAQECCKDSERRDAPHPKQEGSRADPRAIGSGAGRKLIVLLP